MNAPDIPPTDFAEARAEAERLTAEIERLRTAYYSEATSLVSDAEYDEMFHRLEALERAFPELAGQDSPTHEVGAAIVASGFPSHEHAERMLSLDNVFSIEEFREWAEKTRAAAGRDVKWLSEPQDRWPRHQPRVPRRRARDGDDARRRPCGREHHRERALHLGDSRAALG